MKKITYMLVAIILFSINSIFAEAPQAFKYQAIARDNNGNVLANQGVSFQISVLEGSISGTSVYTETQTATTNQFGLANLNIGNGTVVSGTFSTISWGSNTYYVQIEFDAAGGSNYTLMGTSQLLSVPYALYAENISGKYGTFYYSCTEACAINGNMTYDLWTTPSGANPDDILISGLAAMGTSVNSGFSIATISGTTITIPPQPFGSGNGDTIYGNGIIINGMITSLSYNVYYSGVLYSCTPTLTIK